MNEFEIELHFLIEASSKEEALQEFKNIFGNFVIEQADKIEVFD